MQISPFEVNTIFMQVFVDFYVHSSHSLRSTQTCVEPTWVLPQTPAYTKEGTSMACAEGVTGPSPSRAVSSYVRTSTYQDHWHPQLNILECNGGRSHAADNSKSGAALKSQSFKLKLISREAANQLTNRRAFSNETPPLSPSCRSV